MILKYRPHVMRFLGRSNPKTNQPCANKISKPLDLEWNTMGGYLPQDAPAYVSRSIFLSCFFNVLRTLKRATSQLYRRPSNTARWIGRGSHTLSLPNFTPDHHPSPPLRIWGLPILLLNIPRHRLSQCRAHHLHNIHLPPRIAGKRAHGPILRQCPGHSRRMCGRPVVIIVTGPRAV